MATPKWMAGIDTMGAGGAFGLGFLLSALNPKNLLLAAAAGASNPTRAAAIEQERRRRRINEDHSPVA